MDNPAAGWGRSSRRLRAHHAVHLAVPWPRPDRRGHRRVRTVLALASLRDAGAHRTGTPRVEPYGVAGVCCDRCAHHAAAAARAAHHTRRVAADIVRRRYLRRLLVLGNGAAVGAERLFHEPVQQRVRRLSARTNRCRTREWHRLRRRASAEPATRRAVRTPWNTFGAGIPALPQPLRSRTRARRRWDRRDLDDAPGHAVRHAHRT